MDAYLTVKKRLENNYYPFLDSKKLLSEHYKEKERLDFDFENYIIIGIGGSSQGSKAVSHILNCKNIFYFDHLNTLKINKVITNLNLQKTGFVFISKSGNTSEVLTLFDHLCELVKDKINITKNFLTITENNSAPLNDLSAQMGIQIIEHNKEIGGRFSIFSHTGMIPISLFVDDVSNFFDGLDLALSNFIKNTSFENEQSPFEIAKKKYDLISNGINIDVILLYGDELLELGNWMRQLYAESLGKQNFGYLPVISQMTQDQHSMLQLYLDGPKDKFFEFYSADYMESDTFIEIALANHKEAMLKTLKSEKLPIVKVSNYFIQNKYEIGFQLGYFFAEAMLETLILAELGGVDPFGQEAVEKQKIFLKDS